MSDQDNLRERIERQLCMFFDENYDGHLFDASQAIIDDLGMTVEQRLRSWDDEAGEVRYVGRWEANE